MIHDLKSFYILHQTAFTENEFGAAWLGACGAVFEAGGKEEIKKADIWLDRDVNYQIYNLSGHLVESGIRSFNEWQSISSDWYRKFPSGIYLLKLSDSINPPYSRKFVIP